jgi:hypothetical protein
MTKYNMVYPPAGRVLLDGGKNNKYERSIIPDPESPDCANVMFTNGSVGTRTGAQKLNTAAVGSFVCDGIYTRRSNTGAETMVVFYGGTMWTLAGTSFSTTPSAQSVFTAGVRVAATQYENHMFIGNGGVIPYKYNGTDFTRHGVYPPTTTMSAASNGAGNLAGVYSWKVTWVNSSAVEGDVGPANTFTVTATGGQVSLTSIPVAPQSYGVAGRRIYRTDAGGSTYRRVTEISDNTTTTYNDNIASSAVGATAPSDNGVPPKYNANIYHANRVFVNDAQNPNFVWYSGLGEPYTYATTNFDLFGDASADLVKGFAIYDNSLVVFCENSQWLWYMESTDPSDWRKIQIRSSFGSKSPFGAVRYENKVLFPCMQNSKFVGFAAISGDSIEPSASLLTVSAAGSELQSDRIEPDIFEVQEAFVQNISAVAFKNKIYIAFTYGSSNTTNNRVYIFDYSISNLGRKQPAWAPYTGIDAAQFAIYDGKLYYGTSTATGFVYQLETDVYRDDSTAINSYFWTKEFSGYKGQENLEKDFRQVNLLVDKAGAYYMNLTYRVDSDTGEGTTVQVDLNPGSTTWGNFNWGLANWGGGVDQEDIPVYLGGARGKRIQFRFSNQNTINQRFKVHGLKFTYNVRGER